MVAVVAGRDGRGYLDTDPDEIHTLADDTPSDDESTPDFFDRPVEMNENEFADPVGDGVAASDLADSDLADSMPLKRSRISIKR